MKLLDKYIIKKFITTFLFCLIAMTVLVVIVDLSEKTDDFSKTGLTTGEIITQYYFGFIPHIDALLFPLFLFISVVFFTSKMANRSEIVAILSAGVSFKRFLRPYFFCGLFFMGFLWWVNHNILPHANLKWSNFEAKYIDFNYGGYVNTATVSNKHFKLDSFSYSGIRYYDTASKSGSNFFIQRFDTTALVYNLFAQGIRWDTSKKNWQLTQVRIRTIDGLKQTLVDTPQMNVSYNFRPVDLRTDSYLKDQMTTPELNQFIRLEKMRGSEDLNSLILEQQSRNATPVSVLVLTLIGAIMASQKIRGGSGFHLAIGVIICILYILLDRFVSVFSMKAQFNPILAAWLPNIIFAGVAYYLYRITPK